MRSSLVLVSSWSHRRRTPSSPDPPSCSTAFSVYLWITVYCKPWPRLYGLWVTITQRVRFVTKHCPHVSCAVTHYQYCTNDYLVANIERLIVNQCCHGSCRSWSTWSTEFCTDNSTSIAWDRITRTEQNIRLMWTKKHTQLMVMTKRLHVKDKNRYSSQIIIKYQYIIIIIQARENFFLNF